MLLVRLPTTLHSPYNDNDTAFHNTAPRGPPTSSAASVTPASSTMAVTSSCGLAASAGAAIETMRNIGHGTDVHCGNNAQSALCCKSESEACQKQRMGHGRKGGASRRCGPCHPMSAGSTQCFCCCTKGLLCSHPIHSLRRHPTRGLGVRSPGRPIGGTVSPRRSAPRHKGSDI
jgi:hypothetical protein